MQQYFLRYKTHFDAAHYLRGYSGACANLHGHRWKVEVEISGFELNEVGILIDFKLLKAAMEELLPDHCCLNDLPEFETINPTAENIAVWLLKSIKDWLSFHFRGESSRLLFLDQVTVWEAPGASVTVKGGSDA